MYASEFNIENMETKQIQKKREPMRNKTLKRREPLKQNANIEALKKRIKRDIHTDRQILRLYDRIGLVCRFDEKTLLIHSKHLALGIISDL